jgi:hypothetical protein
LSFALKNQMKTTVASAAQEPERGELEPWLAMVRQHVSSLGFGVVQITVHEASVVQIEKTEKFRFPRKQTSFESASL